MAFNASYKLRIKSIPGLATALGLSLTILLASCSQKNLDENSAPTVSPRNISGESLASVQRGESLYQARCQSCHGGSTGGTMMDMPPRHNANGHTWHHPDQQLIDITLNGSGKMGEMMRQMMGDPGVLMPAFKGILTEEDVKDILSYIKTWWTPEQRQSQENISRRYPEALNKRGKSQ